MANSEVRNIKVVGIAGSLRRDSYNRKALRIAGRLMAEAGLRVDYIDLKQLDLPLYDADIEAQGFPDSVKSLRAAVESADIVLIATPEYNHSVPGVLKNAIDWLSTGENMLDGKVAAIFGASTGLFGTMRAQIHLRQTLAALNVMLAPQPQVFIRTAKDMFNDDETLRDAKVHDQLKLLLEGTLQLARGLKGLE
jgi:chromate reductase, NAD(P)H dehydrogenase (quinone)